MSNATGFPSPAQGYEQKALNFNSLIVKNPASTFTFKYEGPGIPSHNVVKGDLLVIDCVKKVEVGSLVMLRTMDGFQCHPIVGEKILKGGQSFFVYDDGRGNEKLCKEVFGVVTSVVREF